MRRYIKKIQTQKENFSENKAPYFIKKKIVLNSQTCNAQKRK